MKKRRKKRPRQEAAETIFGPAEAVAEAVPIPVALVDRSLKIVCLNSLFARRLGLKKGRLEGRKWDRAIPLWGPDIRGVMETGAPLALRTGGVLPGAPGGAVKNVLLWPLRPGDAVVGAFIVIDEASAKKGGKGLRSSIAHYIAHQVRNPLAIAEMALEMLCSACSRGDRGKADAARAIIKHNLDRHRLDMENILGYFEGTVGRRRRVSLVTLLREVLRENRMIMKAKGVRCSLVIDGKPPLVPLVRSTVKRVFNSIVQGVVISTKGRSITVRVGRKGKRVAVAIGESGPVDRGGRFSAGKSRAEGALSTCEFIIERMGGRIKLRTGVVTVSLPLVVDPATKGACL